MMLNIVAALSLGSMAADPPAHPPRPTATITRCQRSGATTRLDFEDPQPAGTNVPDVYTGCGVLFSPGSLIDTVPPAHSGIKVLHLLLAEFSSAPLTLTFRGGVSRVAFFAGTAQPADLQWVYAGSAMAYDAGGNLIAQQGPQAVAGSATSTMFEVKAPGSQALIKRVELRIVNQDQNPVDMAIDDLEFEGAPPPPLSDGPVITFTSPTEGDELDDTTILISGEVKGATLPADVQIKIEFSKPPGDQVPSIVAMARLQQGGEATPAPTPTFSTKLNVGIGYRTITAEVRNQDGQRSTATVHVTNLPRSIPTRYALERQRSVLLGTLQWAWDDGSCQVAVYDNGAIGRAGSTTTVVQGGIFAKWIEILRSRRGGQLRYGDFCPLNEEKETVGGAKRQDFRRGRIYAGMPQGTHYVPAVFAKAVDLLGGDRATGLPLDEAQRSPASKTWLFQQFVRPREGALSVGLPSTLEIKGEPPTLWVERQGGDLERLRKADLVTVNETTGLIDPGTFKNGTATLAESFPCDGLEGPCVVKQTTSDAPIADPHKCHGSWPNSPTWPAITNSDFDVTPLEGWVHSSVMSNTDNSYNHVSHPNPCFSCPSDWVISVEPFNAFVKRLAQTNEQGRIEVEFEYYTAQYVFERMGLVPLLGDRIFAAGRWVIDCWHDSHHSEIHPAFALASMRTAYPNGPPVTNALIWVNGFYPGGDQPVDIVITPPPRTAPNAFLTLARPKDEDAAIDISVAPLGSSSFGDLDSFSFIGARFSAPKRLPAIGWYSMMLYQSGREYAGTWTVGWKTENRLVEKAGGDWWP